MEELAARKQSQPSHYLPYFPVELRWVERRWTMGSLPNAKNFRLGQGLKRSLTTALNVTMFPECSTEPCSTSTTASVRYTWTLPVHVHLLWLWVPVKCSGLEAPVGVIYLARVHYLYLISHISKVQVGHPQGPVQLYKYKCKLAITIVVVSTKYDKFIVMDNIISTRIRHQIIPNLANHKAIQVLSATE